MASQRLINDIKQLNSQGYSESEIRNMLLERGYDQVKVDEALDAVFYSDREEGREEYSGGGRSWLKILIVLVVGVSLLVGGIMLYLEYTYQSTQREQEKILDDLNETISLSLETRGTIDCSGKQISATVKNTGNSDVRASNTNVFVYDTKGNVAASKEGVDLSNQQWTKSGKKGQLSITGLSSSLAPESYYSIELRFVQEDYDWTMGRCRAQ